MSNEMTDIDLRKTYVVASLKTADSLKSLARSESVSRVSHLSLPEVDALVEQVAQLVPAGNIPGMILNGLVQLEDRWPPKNILQRDIGLLFKGIEQTLERAVYGACFMGPAAVIWAYQKLLKLAGKEPEQAFPEGLWQFYLEYALREDTARHDNETHGFDTTLKEHNIQLDAVDRAAAWVMTFIHCLHQYNALLENEWRERVYLRILNEAAGEETYAQLPGEWAKQRPYRRSAEAAQDTYPIYRRKLFDHFLEQATAGLPDALRQEWRQRRQFAESGELPAYQQQMSILAYLEAGPYNESRVSIPLEQACVGVIYQGNYYLIPACAPGSKHPSNVADVRQQIAALMHQPLETRSPFEADWAAITRKSWPRLHPQLSEALLADLSALHYAPILLNCDHRPRYLPLAELRQAERGIGDHPLTCFDTGESFVFDQSHIFFDGGWGAAMAEILTNEALSWAVYLHSLPAAQVGPVYPHALRFPCTGEDLEGLRLAGHAMPEISAETDSVNLKAMLSLRKLMKRRNDLIQLTINDILVLYRAIHALTYEPDTTLVNDLQWLAQSQDEAACQAAEAVLSALSVHDNPAILIPIDASQVSPRDRLYPMTFETPLADLDLLDLHSQSIAALDAYEQATGDRSVQYAEFDQVQRRYLAALAAFGQMSDQAKEIANAGESASMGSIKLLAHLPAPLQHVLDQVPARIDVLNDILKGREVFSNMGAVAPSSTLIRFTTAKDDNENKMLAWGVITDTQEVMHISLRDFRPHVALLIACGHRDLAERVTSEYLNAYARGLNDYVRDVHRITHASRETQMSAGVEIQPEEVKHD